jgi:hypothetical protein
MIFEYRFLAGSVLVASSFPVIRITTTNLEPDEAAELAALMSEIAVGSTATCAGRSSGRYLAPMISRSRPNIAAVARHPATSRKSSSAAAPSARAAEAWMTL